MAFALVFLVPFCWIFYVLSDDSGDPCLTYTFLASEKRSPSHCLVSDNDAISDEDLEAKWYRINSASGNDITQMCPEETCRCTTLFPMWMNDSIPPVSSGIVDRRVCMKGTTSCCEYNLTIRVKNCQSYRVYYLNNNTNGRSRGYCFGNTTQAADPNSCGHAAACGGNGSTGVVYSSSKETHSTSSVSNDPFSLWKILVIVITLGLVLLVIIILFLIFYKKWAAQNERNRIADETLHTIKPRRRRVQ